MNWYQKTITSALFDFKTTHSLKQYVNDVFMDISNGKKAIQEKHKINRFDPTSMKLDSWFVKVLQTANKIWEHVYAGRIEAAVECANRVRGSVHQMSAHFDITNINNKLATILSILMPVLQRQQQQQQQQLQQQQQQQSISPA